MAHTASGNTTSDYFYAYLDVSTSAPDDSSTCTVTVSAGAHCTASSISTAGQFRITFTAGEKSTQYIPSSTGTTYFDIPAGKDLPMGSKTFTYTRETTSSSKTVGVSVFFNLHSTTSSTTASVTIPALKSWQVSYNLKGGSGIFGTQNKYYGKPLTLSSSIPTRVGYKFKGWDTSSNATTVRYSPGGSYTQNEAVILYAVWEAYAQTFIFNSNTGTGSMSNQVITYASSGTTNLTPNTFTKTNYDFIEWNTEPDGSGADYNNAQAITRNLITSDSTINLYAQWELIYIAPQITILNGIRSEQNSNNSTINVAWTRGNNGSDIPSTQLSIAYKLSTSSTWTYVTATGGTSSTQTWIDSSGTTYETTINTSSNNQYDIQATVRNSGNYTSYATSRTSFISSTFYIIDIGADDRAIGLLASAPTSTGINISDAIKNLGSSGLSATGTGGIAIGARSSTNTITSAGSGSIASGYAQGGSIEATTKGAFAGGLADGNNKITASGVSSFAFGQSNNTAALTASGNCAIAMGLGCTASGAFSLAHNMYNTAAKRAQTVIGTWNTIDNNTSSHPAGTSGTNAEYGKYAFIIGNGTGASARSNAFAVNWNGTIEMNDAPMTDWIVEQGPVSSPTWWKYYRKWNSGLFELDGYYSGAPTSGSHYNTTANGTLYCYRSENYSFPSVCVPTESNYTVLASWRIGSGFALDGGTVGSQTTEKFSIYAISTAGSQSTIAVRIYVRGRWK